LQVTFGSLNGNEPPNANTASLNNEKITNSKRVRSHENEK
jgi:hypothetical protein